MATYPGGIYSPRTKNNKEGVVYDADEDTTLFAEDVVNDDNEIVAIETELGTNPKGSAATVKERIEDIENFIPTNVIYSALDDDLELPSPGGSPIQGQKLMVRITDDGTSRALTYNAIYREGDDLALPTATVIDKTMYLGFIYNDEDSKWDFVAYIDNI